MFTPMSLTRGLAGCTEYDANNVCLVFDPTTPDDVLTPTPKPPTNREGTGLEVIDEAIAAATAAAARTGSTVPLSKCPWYARPEIGETALICKFPSTSVLILGGAAILGLVFFSMRD